MTHSFKNSSYEASDTIMTRGEFLEHFRELAYRFKKKKDEATQTERNFFAAMARCTEVAQRSPLAESQIEKDNPLRTTIEDTAGSIRDLLTNWDDKVHQQKIHADFKQQRCADSFLIFVYGKVKAGKSSLGNYVAWGRHDPDTAVGSDPEQEPTYFVENSKGITEVVTDADIRSQRKFKVDGIEATSAIQGFHLPGLTWADSPGLHSKNEGNGDLAREYVDAADIILYLTSSGAPCKRSDLTELEALGRKQHNMAVLITGSDTYDEDVDDDGNLVKVLAMKSPADRQAQVAYVEKSLRNHDTAAAPESEQVMARTLEQAKAFSISVKYAEEHPDPESMLESGIGPMLHHVALLAKGTGVWTKVARPLLNLRAFLHGILERDLPTLQQQIETCKEMVQQNQRQARERAQAEIMAVRLGLDQQIDRLLTEHGGSSGAFKRAVNVSYSHQLRAAMQKAAVAYASTMEQQLPQSLQDFTEAIPDFRVKTQTVQRKRSLRAKQGAAVGAAILGGAAMIFTGGLAGVALAAAGTLLGGAAGTGIGGLLDDEESLEISTGNNTHEVGLKAREVLLQRLDTDMGLCLESLDTACYSGLISWIEQLQAAVEEFHSTTAHLLQDVECRLEDLSASQ